MVSAESSLPLSMTPICPSKTFNSFAVHITVFNMPEIDVCVWCEVKVDFLLYVYPKLVLV